MEYISDMFTAMNHRWPTLTEYGSILIDRLVLQSQKDSSHTVALQFSPFSLRHIHAQRSLDSQSTCRDGTCVFKSLHLWWCEQLSRSVRWTRLQSRVFVILQGQLLHVLLPRQLHVPWRIFSMYFRRLSSMVSCLWWRKWLPTLWGWAHV